jgi:hypothetical protein
VIRFVLHALLESEQDTELDEEPASYLEAEIETQIEVLNEPLFEILLNTQVSSLYYTVSVRVVRD